MNSVENTILNTIIVQNKKAILFTLEGSQNGLFTNKYTADYTREKYKKNKSEYWNSRYPTLGSLRLTHASQAQHVLFLEYVVIWGFKGLLIQVDWGLWFYYLVS